MIYKGIPLVRVSIAVLAACIPLLLAGCGGGSTPTLEPTRQPAPAQEQGPTATPAPTQTTHPTSTPMPTPTAEPTATPTPVPTPTQTAEEMLSELLASVQATLAAMSTAEFEMIDETETGAKFFGTTFKSLEGKVKSPDSFWMLVKVVAPGLGFAEIEMMAVGDEALMKFSEGAPWTPLPLEQVPFNFGEIGITLSRLLPAMSNVSLVGQETVGDTRTLRIEGTIDSGGMSALITGVDPGHTVTLTFWVHEQEHTLRQFRIAGMLFNDDGPETLRLLDISGVNVDVDIQLPDPADRQ